MFLAQHSPGYHWLSFALGVLAGLATVLFFKWKRLGRWRNR